MLNMIRSLFKKDVQPVTTDRIVEKYPEPTDVQKLIGTLYSASQCDSLCDLMADFEVLIDLLKSVRDYQDRQNDLIKIPYFSVFTITLTTLLLNYIDLERECGKFDDQSFLIEPKMQIVDILPVANIYYKTYFEHIFNQKNVSVMIDADVISLISESTFNAIKNFTHQSDD